MVRLLSGEMDQQVLTEEILYKARRPSRYRLSNDEWDHLKKQPFHTPLAIGAFGKAMADLAEAMRKGLITIPKWQSPRQ
jgi:hypothetical protein